MNDNTLESTISKTKAARETSKNKSVSLVDQLIEDIVHYNDIETDLNKDDLPSQIDLMKKLKNYAGHLLQQAIIVSGSQQPVKVAVVGNFSAGKSSFINSLIQENICPVNDKSTTSSVTTFTYSHNKAFYVCELNEVKKKITLQQYEQMIQHGTAQTIRGSAQFFIEGPWEFVRDVSLIDTPGFERSEDTFSTALSGKGGDDIVTENIIKEQADILFWLMDINNGSISKDQKDRIQRLKQEKPNIDIYVILNKAKTKVSGEGREKILQGIKKDLGILIKEVILYSSVIETTTSFGVKDIIQNIEESINRQSLKQIDNWAIRLSSSFGGRGILKFQYNDNGAETIFSSQENSAHQLGRVLDRLEILRKLKEIGHNNKEIANNNLQLGQENYEYHKSELRIFKKEIENRLETLKRTAIKGSERYNAFDRHLTHMCESFLQSCISAFMWYDSNQFIIDSISIISEDFIAILKICFKEFSKNIKNELGYGWRNDPIIDFDLPLLFSGLLSANLKYDKVLQFACKETLDFFIEYLKIGFIENECLNKDKEDYKWTQIIKKIEKIC